MIKSDAWGKSNSNQIENQLLKFNTYLQLSYDPYIEKKGK